MRGRKQRFTEEKATKEEETAQYKSSLSEEQTLGNTRPEGGGRSHEDADAGDRKIEQEIPRYCADDATTGRKERKRERRRRKETGYQDVNPRHNLKKVQG